MTVNTNKHQVHVHVPSRLKTPSLMHRIAVHKLVAALPLPRPINTIHPPEHLDHILPDALTLVASLVDPTRLLGHDVPQSALDVKAQHLLHVLFGAPHAVARAVGLECAVLFIDEQFLGVEFQAVLMQEDRSRDGLHEAGDVEFLLNVRVGMCGIFFLPLVRAVQVVGVGREVFVVQAWVGLCDAAAPEVLANPSAYDARAGADLIVRETYSEGGLRKCLLVAGAVRALAEEWVVVVGTVVVVVDHHEEGFAVDVFV